MLTTLAVFAVSLAALLTAARYFTHSAERVGLALGMSPFAIGVPVAGGTDRQAHHAGSRGCGTACAVPPRRDVVVMVVASGFIYLGARFTIGALETLALQLGIAPDLIALTLLSLGTTLPELVVSATAAREGRADVAVGNVLGSCVFNTLAVAGTASVVGHSGFQVEERCFSEPGKSCVVYSKRNRGI